MSERGQEPGPRPVWWEAAECLLRSVKGKMLRDAAEEGRSLNITGLPDPAKSFLLAVLAESTSRSAVVFVPDEARARAMQDDLACFLDENDILTFHAREYPLYDARAVSRDQELARAAVLTRLIGGAYRILMITADGAMQRLNAPSDFAVHVMHLRSGDPVDPDRLESQLVSAGYERVPQIECPGHFARRGDILDIWAPGTESGTPHAVRLSFFDVVIDELKALDPETQRSLSVLKEVVLPPAREFILTEVQRVAAAEKLESAAKEAVVDARRSVLPRDVTEKIRLTGERDAERFRETLFFPSLERWLPLFQSRVYTVWDYIDKKARPLMFLDEPLDFSRRLDAAHAGFSARLAGFVEKGEAYALSEACEVHPADVMRAIDQNGSFLAFAGMAVSGNGLPGAASLALHARLSDRYRTNPDRLSDDLQKCLSGNGAALLFAGDPKRAERLSEFLAERGIPAAPVLPDLLPRGFVLDSPSVFVLGTEDVFGTQRIRGLRKKHSRRSAFFRDLVPGALVVHEDHGIGRYEGTETIETGDGTRDYLTIVYQDAKLHLPVDRIDLISPYIPAGNARPKLSKMGGTEWTRQKERARNSIRRLVTDIVALYAKRRKIKGHVYGPDTPWQHEFEDAFPFEDTDDQKRVIADIKGDMESDKVMDRLVCGDVGFGKTELAFRAMFKCVMEGRQAAMLAPTTVLVQQHFDNFRERVAPFPVKVRQLSRFVTEDGQKRTIWEIQAGTADVVIGTHRLLSKDVLFHDLGLLVIDEEQRFGVDHKEMIKNISPDVEVLTLTATPIPRTLHMSLSGIHDISLLEEGPEDRLPIQTAVIEYDEDLVVDAVMREQARRGQVFYVHNNTHTIDRRARELAEKMPGVRFGVAHGKMSERSLERVIQSFLKGEFDVLVCTTIIESGIDMPRVNTLIIENADRFGLAQLYQLRGRVGRSGRQAYALITYDPEHVIGEMAEKRLEAIRDFTELGSGFQIALRDLEVRGAGNLLGAEQSGHLEAIGYDLYCKMLEEAVVDIRGDKKPEPHAETVIELVTDATLPLRYVREGEDRLEIYRKIAAIRTIEDYRDVYDELLDRYGDVPEEAVALLDIAYIRAFGERAGFSRIRVSGRDVEMMLDAHAAGSMDLISRLVSAAGARDHLTFMAGKRPMVVMMGAAERAREIPGILRDLFSAAERTE